MLIHALVVIGFILMVLGPCAIAVYGRSGETVDEAVMAVAAAPAEPESAPLSAQVFDPMPPAVKAAAALAPATAAGVPAPTAPPVMSNAAPAVSAPAVASAPLAASAASASAENTGSQSLSLEALVGSATAAVLLADALAAHAKAMSLNAGAEERKLREASELAEFAASSLRRSAEAIAAARVGSVPHDVAVFRGPRAA